MTLEEEFNILNEKYGKVNLIELDELFLLCDRKKKVLLSYVNLIEYSFTKGNIYLIVSGRSTLKSKDAPENLNDIMFLNKEAVNIQDYFYFNDRERYNLFNNIKSKLGIPSNYFDEIVLTKELLTYLNFNLSIKIYEEIKGLHPFIVVGENTNIYSLLDLNNKEFEFILANKGKRVSRKEIHSNINASNIKKSEILFKIYSLKII